ncbi:hypothetical protein, partial [Limosilactobacillus reuteri]|uniref:hypothetical protein n=1 Tax=Limosilactobacillus reuteri TaxID=1598 RepID=UPI001CDC37E2
LSKIWRLKIQLSKIDSLKSDRQNITRRIIAINILIRFRIVFIFNLKAVLKAIISFKLINPLQAKTAQTALKRKIEHIEKWR